MQPERHTADVDGAPMTVLLVSPGPGPFPPAILFGELFGPDGDLLATAASLAALGLVVAIPDVHHRHGPDEVQPRTDAGRARGFELINALTRDGVRADVAATVAVLADRADTTDDPPALVGFSVGGHLAFLAATQVPVRAAAVVYGGWLTTTGIPVSRPEPTATLADRIDPDAHVLLVAGTADPHVPPADVAVVAAALRTAGVAHAVEHLEGAPHAFFFPASPDYDERHHDRAWRAIVALVTR